MLSVLYSILLSLSSNGLSLTFEQQNSPEKYQQFLTIMRGYKANPTTPANEVYDQVKLLFADKTSLIEGFKNFMPAKSLQESGEAYKSEEEVRMVTTVLEKSKL